MISHTKKVLILLFEVKMIQKDHFHYNCYYYIESDKINFIRNYIFNQDNYVSVKENKKMLYKKNYDEKKELHCL